MSESAEYGLSMDDHELQLQIPHFVYNGPLVVAGGGAELLPGAWFNHQPPPVCQDRRPFDFALHDHDDDPPPRLHNPDFSALLALRSVYSASGFDFLSILARVHTRPNPAIVLGAVDLTCAFVVVDVSQYDSPIVYCSPSFCALTGYPAHEVIGRNCRFLQAPGGAVHKGDPRMHTSQDAVNLLRKSLVAGKECQTSILNYKKDGTPFCNLVTVIPLPNGLTGSPDEQDIIYHVGFQVDLGEQPSAIHEKLRDGTYIVNYAAQDQSPRNFNAPRKANSIPPPICSTELRRLLDDPTLRSVPLANSPASSEDTGPQNSPLSLVLLEALPGFIHVVSLKGAFLYVAPSVQRVLGYRADELVGKCISDYAHPQDVIPLMRELKEGSATGPAPSTVADAPFGMPRSIDLLFRARTKMGRYVWVESRGRLHVEPGKGRKAIILSGQAREMMSLKWDDVRRAGGLARGLRVPFPVLPPASQAQREDPTSACLFRNVEQEVWGMLGGMCRRTATFMSVGRGVLDVLGWTPDELLGTPLMGLVCDEAAQNTIGGSVEAMREYQALVRRGRPLPQGDGTRMRKMRCKLRRKDAERPADVWFVIYRADAEAETDAGERDVEPGAGDSITPAPLVYQIRLVSAEAIVPGPNATTKASAKPASPYLSSLAGAISLPPPFTPATSTPPLLSFDMFDELSRARASSWQYELQQLRITNMKLYEELAGLEDAEAAASRTGQGNGVVQPRHIQDRAGYEDQHMIRYEGDARSAACELPLPAPPPQQEDQQHHMQQYRPYGEIPPQPLFTMQPQRPSATVREQQGYGPPHLVQYEYEYEYDYHVPDFDMRPPRNEDQPRSYQSYLHHPTPTPAPSQRQFAHADLPRREPVPYPRPGRRGTPFEWNTMPSGPPLRSPVVAMPVPAYASPPPVSYGPLKRTWSAAGN